MATEPKTAAMARYCAARRHLAGWMPKRIFEHLQNMSLGEVRLISPSGYKPKSLWAVGWLIREYERAHGLEGSKARMPPGGFLRTRQDFILVLQNEQEVRAWS